MSGQSDFKEGKRFKSTRKQHKAVAAEKLGPCRSCQQPGTHLHHLVFRSQNGGDEAANLIPLCLWCHDTFHKKTANWAVVAVNIRSRLTIDEIAYVKDRKGAGWLDVTYPTGLEGEDNAVAVHGRDPDAAVTASSPSETCKRCNGSGAEPHKEHKPVKPRPKRTFSIAVPADAEDGKEVLKTLFAAVADELRHDLGYDENTPAYFLLTAVLADWLSGRRVAA